MGMDTWFQQSAPRMPTHEAQGKLKRATSDFCCRFVLRDRRIHTNIINKHSIFIFCKITSEKAD